jgi:hypothetical protein
LQKVLEKFEKKENKLINKRLDEEKQKKLAFIERAREGGLESAKKREEERARSVENKHVLKSKSSLSTSTSTSTSIENNNSNFAETSSADTKSVDADFEKKEEAFTDNPVKAKPKKEKKVESETKETSVYTECMDIYCRFIKFNNGVPVINSLAGKSLKEIIAHLKTASIDKGEGQDKEVVETFYGILKGYKRWQPFHQGQTKLNQINSNLQDIILAVNNKNPNQNGKPTSLYQQSITNPFQ